MVANPVERLTGIKPTITREGEEYAFYSKAAGLILVCLGAKLGKKILPGHPLPLPVDRLRSGDPGEVRRAALITLGAHGFMVMGDGNINRESCVVVTQDLRVVDGRADDPKLRRGYEELKKAFAEHGTLAEALKKLVKEGVLSKREEVGGDSILCEEREVKEA